MGGVPGQSHTILPGWLRLSLHINEGAVWGVGGDHPFVLLFMTALIIPAVAVLAWSCRDGKAPLWALGLLLGGAAGNLYDRIFIREQVMYAADPVAGVRDFVDMGIPGVYNWPVYNVADVAIVGGVLIFAGWNILHGEKKSPQDTAAPSADSGNQPQ